MFKNYLKIAWRNHIKHKMFSIINILGLAIGIAACLLIFLFVHHELTFDRYNKKADRTVRITTTLHTPESDLVLATDPVLLGNYIKKDFPEVETMVRFAPAPQAIKSGNEVFSETNFYQTDQEVFDVFSFEFLEGSPKNALQNRKSIVITEKIAKKYFGQNMALGKTMICNGQTFLVTGVVRNRPRNSDMQIDALISAEYPPDASWMDDFDHYTYVLFRTTPDLKKFQKKLNALSTKYIQPELNKIGAEKYKVDFQVELLKDVHFSTGKLADTPKGNKQFSYIFSLLAIFILIIALLNYINLSTAKSAERAKEVGIRKVSGAGRPQLIRQFLLESFFLLGIACVLGVAAVEGGLPFFNKFLQTELETERTQVLFFVLVVFLITVLLAGLYPAFVLSSFRPVQVLKGSWRHSRKGVVLRKMVTVIQFAIAAALIMGTTVIFSQMKFIRQQDLGFNKDQLLNIYMPRDSMYMSSVHAFQNALRQRSEVQDMTIGTGLTSSSMASTTIESDGKKREVMCIYYSIDSRFLPVFQIKLLEGRNLSNSFSADKSEAFLVNESFLKMMGWKSGIGKSVEGFGHKGKIIGVVKNFYYQSLHSVIDPVLLVYNLTPSNTTTVRISPKHLPLIKNIYKQYLPLVPIDYAFFDELVDKQYQTDKLTMSLFNGFTLLAILISCMGLYGLVALIAGQRTKEMGIRKVLGASLLELLGLMTKDFLLLVSWSLVISLPIAAIAMNKWLTSYAYHIHLNVVMFLIPVILLLFITILIIMRESWKTARVNPVESLRSE